MYADPNWTITSIFCNSLLHEKNTFLTGGEFGQILRLFWPCSLRIDVAPGKSISVADFNSNTAAATGSTSKLPRKKKAHTAPETEDEDESGSNRDSSSSEDDISDVETDGAKGPSTNVDDTDVDDVETDGAKVPSTDGNNNVSISSTQWVVVKYAGKKSLSYFLGQVLEVVDDGIKVTFVKRQPGSDS